MPRALSLREHLRNAGRAGKGASKRRSPEQYREIQAKARHSRRVKAARRMLDAAVPGDPIADPIDVSMRIGVMWGQDVLRDALALED